MTPYLKENVGPAVAKALQALTKTQPADPVEFVGKFLKEYVAAERTWADLQQDQKNIKAKREKFQAEEDIKQKEQAAKDTIVTNLEKKYDSMSSKLEEPLEWDSTNWKQILDICQEKLKARNACFGTKYDVDDAGPEFIKFELSNGENVTDKILAAEQGVTWKCFEEQPVPDGFEGEDEWDKFQALHVDDITTEYQDNVHFFKWSQIGSFLSIPIVYDSYLSVEAIDASKVFDEATKEEEEPDPEKVRELPSTIKTKVMTFDTLGSTDKFTQAQIDTVSKLIVLARKGIAKAEWSQVVKQAQGEVPNAEEKEANETAFAEYRASLDETGTYSLTPRKAEYAEANEGAEMPAEELEKLEQDLSIQKAKDLLKNNEKLLTHINNMVVMREDVQKLLQGVALMVGFKHAEISDGRGRIDTVKLALLMPKVLEKVAVANVRSPRLGLEKPYQKLKYIQGLLPAEGALSEADQASANYLYLSALIEWLQIATDVRSKDVAVRKAQLEKEANEAAEKAAAEAEPPADGEEAPEPVPVVIDYAAVDDDFVDDEAE